MADEKLFWMHSNPSHVCPCPKIHKARDGRVRAQPCAVAGSPPPLRAFPDAVLGARGARACTRDRGAQAPASPPPGPRAAPRTPLLDFPKHGEVSEIPDTRLSAGKAQIHAPETKHTWNTQEAGRHPIKHTQKTMGWRSGPTREQGGTFE